MCEQCYNDGLYYEDPFDGFFLYRARHEGELLEPGDWGLGIIDDPLIGFSVTPRPINNLEDLTSDELNDTVKFFHDCQYVFSKTDCLDLEGINKLFKAMEEKGYKENKEFRWYTWLFDYLGRFIEDQIPTSHMKHSLTCIKEKSDYNIGLDICKPMYNRYFKNTNKGYLVDKDNNTIMEYRYIDDKNVYEARLKDEEEWTECYSVPTSDKRVRGYVVVPDWFRI